MKVKRYLPQLQMSLNERASLVCAPEDAYGARGIPGVYEFYRTLIPLTSRIPPNSTLMFDVELLKIEN